MENTVFILEQDALSAKTLSESLEYIGCKPLVFSTLKSAEENIKLHRPEIFLLNPVLLSCNRQECFETVGKLRCIAPVIFLARRSKQTGDRGQETGNRKQILYQPFTLTQLQEVVSTYVQLERGFLFERATGEGEFRGKRGQGDKGKIFPALEPLNPRTLDPFKKTSGSAFKFRLWTFLFLFSILSGFFLSTVVLPAGENIFLSMKYLSSFPQRLEGYLQRDETRELERR